MKENMTKNKQFILGEEINKFENKLLRVMGSKYALTTSSGTTAIELALKAAGVKAGDEVITTSFTWLSTVGSIVNVGAKPIFVDVNADTFLLDYKLVEKKISKKTKAIIFVSLFGSSTDLEKVKKIAHKYKIFLIDDAAQSFGSKIKKLGIKFNSDINFDIKKTLDLFNFNK